MAVNYEKEGKIAIFTINRPEALNALNGEVREELNDALLDFRDNPDSITDFISQSGRCSDSQVIQFERDFIESIYC